VKYLLPLLLMLTSLQLFAADKDYALQPRQLAEGTYLLPGLKEHFDFRNGGNIVNTAFIVTGEGVVVIDTGPSRLYGEQLRAAIAEITPQPIVQVYITHMHPDHFLGNQAFENVPIAALGGTREGIRKFGESFNDNMYRLVGSWMRGTRVVVPDRTVAPGVREIGGHRLRLIALQGHTGNDLVLLDETTGVLFTGDLAFHGRTPTTPHAELEAWQASLAALRELDFRLLVPGHGEPVAGTLAIDQTADYLSWLEAHFTEAAESGAAMAELLHPRAPSRVRNLAVFADEYVRSLSHLYPALEAKALVRGRVEQGSLEVLSD
jgi:quinoprotein relay system zinc metallohydrolase 1